MEGVNQEEFLSAVFLLFLSLRESLTFFNCVGKLYAKQLWCLYMCLSEHLVNAKISPLTFDYNDIIAGSLGHLYNVFAH